MSGMMIFDLDLNSSRSFIHGFAIKLLKYVTSCHVHSMAHTDLDGFFPYLAQIITCIRGCVNKSKVKATQVIRFFSKGWGKGILVDH